MLHTALPCLHRHSVTYHTAIQEGGLSPLPSQTSRATVSIVLTTSAPTSKQIQERPVAYCSDRTGVTSPKPAGPTSLKPTQELASTRGAPPAPGGRTVSSRTERSSKHPSLAAFMYRIHNQMCCCQLGWLCCSGQKNKGSGSCADVTLSGRHIGASFRTGGHLLPRCSVPSMLREQPRL